jgi:hypothetical protein
VQIRTGCFRLGAIEINPLRLSSLGALRLTKLRTTLVRHFNPIPVGLMMSSMNCFDLALGRKDDLRRPHNAA